VRRTRRGTARSACPSRVAWASVRGMSPDRGRAELPSGQRNVAYDEFVTRVACAALALCAAAILAGAASSGVTVQANRFVRFTDLPRGSLGGIPRDVRPNSRIVGAFGRFRVATGPTRNGNYCEAVGTSSWGVGGCVARNVRWHGQPGELKPYLLRPSSLSSRQGITFVGGSVFAKPGQRLVLVYADGERERVSLTFVSRPIGAAFFLRKIAPAHQTAKTRLRSLELRRGSRLIARQRIRPPWSRP
jgi:hypothetical protein